MKDTWIDLLKSSILIQSAVTLILVCAYVYMLLAGIQVSPEFYGLMTTVVGFWLGSKVGYTQGQGQAQARRVQDTKVGD